MGPLYAALGQLLSLSEPSLLTIVRYLLYVHEQSRVNELPDPCVTGRVPRNSLSVASADTPPFASHCDPGLPRCLASQTSGGPKTCTAACPRRATGTSCGRRSTNPFATLPPVMAAPAKFPNGTRPSN